MYPGERPTRPWWSRNERIVTGRAHDSANGRSLNEPECDLVQEHPATRDGAHPHLRLLHLLRHQERLA